MIYRAYKYRIYPTKKQVEYLRQTFGCVRFVWNQLVANFNSWSSEGPNRPMNEKILNLTRTMEKVADNNQGMLTSIYQEIKILSERLNTHIAFHEGQDSVKK